MKGTILDFLKLAAEKPELAKELVGLAAKYDFEFSDEMSDEDLENVAGGTGESAQLVNIELVAWLQKQQQTIQLYSNTSKSMHDTTLSGQRKFDD